MTQGYWTICICAVPWFKDWPQMQPIGTFRCHRCGGIA